MSLLAHAFSAHSAYHEDTDFGLLLTAFGAGLARISATQNQFVRIISSCRNFDSSSASLTLILVGGNTIGLADGSRISPE